MWMLNSDLLTESMARLIRSFIGSSHTLGAPEAQKYLMRMFNEQTERAELYVFDEHKS
jgi:hypothetical protein